MADIQFGIRLTADGSGFVGTMTAATAQVEKLSAAARGSAPDLAKMDAGMKESMTSAVAMGVTIGNLATEGVKALAKWAAATVTAAAELKNWADETGSTVESLSKLTNYAKVSGQELGALRSATEKLSVGLTGTDEESKRAGKALALLGIQSRDPATAMFELAKVLDGYADGANKATLANDIWGRGGAKLLPLMKDMATQGDIAATTTTRQAEEAETLSKSLNRLGVETGLLRDALLGWLVPALNDLIGKFKAASSEADGFWGMLRLGVKNVANGIEESNVTEKLGGLRKELATMKELAANWDPNAKGNVFRKFVSPEEIADAEKYIRYLEKVSLLTQSTLNDKFNAGGRQIRADQLDKPEAPVVTKVPAASKFKEAKIEVTEFDKEMEKLEKSIAGARLELAELFRTEPIAKAEKALVALMASADWKTFTKEEQESTAANYAFIESLEKETEQWKLTAKAAGDYAGERAKERAAFEDQSKKAQESLNDMIKSIEDETRAIGLSANERERLIAIKGLDSDRTKALISSELEYVAILDRINKAFDDRGAKEALVKSLEDQKAAWKSTYDDISGIIVNSIEGAFSDVKNAGKSLLDGLKQIFSKFVIRPIIQAVTAPLANSLTGAVGGLFSGGANASGGGGNLLSGLASLFGGGGAPGGGGAGGVGGAASGLSGLTSLSSSYSTITSMFSTGTALMEGAATAFATSTAGAAVGLSGVAAGSAVIEAGSIAAGTALTTAGTAVVAMIPVVGWIAAAAIALWAIFGNKGGGPKSGGFASTGDISSITKTDNSGRWFTPSGSDSSVQKLIDANAKGYTEILKALGGKGKAGFALGFDTDPEGTAPNRVHAGAFVNGRQVYDAALGDLGRDEETLKKALDVESKRSLLAALQASDLPDAIAAVLNSVLAKTATAEDIDRVVSLGAAFKDLMLALDGDVIADVEKAWTSSQRNRLQVLRDMGDGLTKLSANFDGSVDATRALTAATNEYRGAVAQTLLAIKQISASVGAMFADTKTQLQIAGLTPEALYRFWSNQADDAVRELATATDPTTIGLLAQKINASLSNAFSAVSPEQQAMVKNPLIDYITEADALVQSRLSAAATLVGTEASAPFTAVQSALNLAVDKMTQAATDQQTAATNANTAAINSNTAAANMNNAANIMTGAANTMSAATDRLGSITIPISMPAQPAWVNG